MGTGCHGYGADAARAGDAKAWSKFRVVIATAIGVVLTVPGAQAAKPAPRPPTAQGAFTDQFTSFDTARWVKADGWANGSPFDNGWRADHATVAGGLVDLRLDDVPSSGQPYTSGEVRTSGYYGYGCYEASFKPVRRSGVVSAFFTFAGPFDNGGNGRHNEIDVEFLGYDTTRVQFNFYTNDDTYSSRNEKLVDLGFDAADSFHRYGFKWTSTGIEWFVDGQRIYSVGDSGSNPTPKATESLQKIMVNVWPVDDTAAAWAGVFTYPGQALHGQYDWVRYMAGETCEFGPPPSEPPPPTGGATEVLVQQVATALDPRGTQVIARVAVVDDLGRPVAGASVQGAWSGVITSGDTNRTSDAGGVATFYSSRTRTTGEVKFCVTSVQAAGLAYDGSSNLVTCGILVK